jgi:hypothetical protein
MEHSNIASIAGEKMMLRDTNNTARTQFTMPEVENLMEEVSQPMDMEEEDAFHDDVLVSLRTLWILILL